MKKGIKAAVDALTKKKPKAEVEVAPKKGKADERKLLLENQKQEAEEKDDVEETESVDEQESVDEITDDVPTINLQALVQAQVVEDERAGEAMKPEEYEEPLDLPHVWVQKGDIEKFSNQFAKELARGVKKNAAVLRTVRLLGWDEKRFKEWEKSKLEPLVWITK